MSNIWSALRWGINSPGKFSSLRTTTRLSCPAAGIKGKVPNNHRKRPEHDKDPGPLEKEVKHVEKIFGDDQWGHHHSSSDSGISIGPCGRAGDMGRDG